MSYVFYEIETTIITIFKQNAPVFINDKCMQNGTLGHRKLI